MKRFSEQNHYEILEVPAWAIRSEIYRAYELLRSTFDDNAIASYSLFSKEELAEIRTRIEEAFRTLSDENRRRSYDGTLPPETWVGRPFEREAGGNLSETAVSNPPDVQIAEAALKESGYSGEALRKYRTASGISLDRVHEATRISLPHLSAIEDEEDAKLPHEVYLKAYLVQYARKLGLDPESVVKGYLARLRYRQAGHPR